MITILFIISLICIFVMLGSKIFEIKVRKIHILANLFSKGDVRIHNLIEIAIFKYNHYKKIAKLFIFDFLPAYSYEMAVKLKDYIAKKYYQAGDKFNGRRILRDNGSVSTFLQHITEDASNKSHHKA